MSATSAFGVPHATAKRPKTKLIARPRLDRAITQAKLKINSHAMIHGPKYMGALGGLADIVKSAR